MPRYKVRDGSVLPHEGTLFEAGAIVELPRHIGEDSIVRSLVQEVDETGAPVVLVDAEADERDLERFRPHERITLLQNRMVDARALLTRLEQRLLEEQQIIEQAAAPPSSAEAPTDEER